MHWTTTAFVCAALFPVVTLAGLVVAWGRDRQFALATLGFSLFAAAVHAAVTGLSVLPMEWCAICLGASLLAGFRVDPPIVGILGSLALVFLGFALYDQWRLPGERFTTLLGGCPVGFGRTWLFEASGDEHRQFRQAWSNPSWEAGRSPASIGGVTLASIGAELEVPQPRDLAEESPAIELSDDSIALLRRSHDDVVWGFTESMGLEFDG